MLMNGSALILGPMDSPRNSGVNRSEINRDPPQQAQPTDLNVNLNNSSKTLPKNTLLQVPRSSIRSSLSSVYHDALMAPVCENGETLPKSSVPRSSIRSSLSSHLSVYHDALMKPVCEESKNGETSPKNAVPFSTTTTTALPAQNTNEEDSRLVRFGGVEDADREIEKRVSLEKEQHVIGTYPIFH
jgi:hypothetical protein